MDGPQRALFMHRPALWLHPAEEGRSGGVEGVSGQWGVGRKGEGEKTAGIKSSARTDEIRASGRGSEEEEKPE